MNLKSLTLISMKLIAQFKIMIFFNHKIQFDFDNNDKNRFYIIKN